MKKYFILSLTASVIILSGSLVSSTVFAQEAAPAVSGEHKRIDQVEKRLDNQQEKLDAAEQAGKITPEQAVRDEKRLTNQENQLKVDELKNDGHITKHEQKVLNKELNKNNKIDRKQKVHEYRKGRHEEKGDVTPTTPAPTTPVTQ